jgi:hypothetical protein
MIDKELHDYIMSLLNQGYDIDSIKEILIKAGHDIKKVETISVIVFEMFHKELINFIDEELEKGRNVDEIKKDLLKAGHSEEKLKQIMHYHKKKMPYHQRIRLNDFIQREKIWLKSWLKIYFYLILVITALFGIVTFIVLSGSNSPSNLNYESRIKICNELQSEDTLQNFYGKVCLAALTEKESICLELQDNKLSTSCSDSYNIYLFYLTRNKDLCSKIDNQNLREYCFQLSDNLCNNYFGYSEYCLSIVNNNISACTTKTIQTSAEKAPILESCYDNYQMYYSLQKKQQLCKKITNPKARDLCSALSR